MSRDVLYNLIESIDEEKIETVYRILLKFVSEEVATLDEVDAIRDARIDIANGKLYTHDEVWL